MRHGAKESAVGRRAVLVTLLGTAAAACTNRAEPGVSTMDPQAVQATALPSPTTGVDASLVPVLADRRSVRDYDPDPLSEEEVSLLLWSAQGVTSGDGKRTAPSAGARYPLEAYVADQGGLRHYLPDTHELVRMGDADLRARLQAAALDQESVGAAPVVVVLTGVEARTAERYGDRAFRYVAMEAGHAAQNVLLMAVALELAAVPIGGFDDAQVADVLDLPDGEAPMYLLPVGHPVG